MSQDFFQLCIKGIKDNLRILSFDEKERALSLFHVMFPLYEPCALYWDTEGCDEKLREAYKFSSIIDALELLLKRRPENIQVYLIWDNSSLPVAQANLFEALDHLINLSSASTPFFIVNFQWGFALEWRCALKIFRIADKDKIELVQQLDDLLLTLGVQKLHNNTNHIRKRVKNRFGFAKETIAWDIIDHQMTLYDHKNLTNELRSFHSPNWNNNVTVLWTDQHLPGIETRLDALTANWDKLNALSKSFYLIDNEYNFIVWVSGSTIKIGSLPNRSRLIIAQ